MGTKRKIFRPEGMIFMDLHENLDYKSKMIEIYLRDMIDESGNLYYEVKSSSEDNKNITFDIMKNEKPYLSLTIHEEYNMDELNFIYYFLEKHFNENLALRKKRNKAAG